MTQKSVKNYSHTMMVRKITYMESKKTPKGRAL